MLRYELIGFINDRPIIMDRLKSENRITNSIEGDFVAIVRSSTIIQISEQLSVLNEVFPNTTHEERSAQMATTKKPSKKIVKKKTAPKKK